MLLRRLFLRTISAQTRNSLNSLVHSIVLVDDFRRYSCVKFLATLILKVWEDFDLSISQWQSKSYTSILALQTGSAGKTAPKICPV
jgi:hypothetical protein